MMSIKELVELIKFDIGQPVEFAIKQGRDHGIIENIVLTPDGILYEVIWSNKSVIKHYDFELIEGK